MELGNLSINALSSRMLKPFPVNPSLESATADAGLDLMWNKPVIAADVIVLHNPSFLKFDERMKSRLVCDTLIIVSHENFLGPDGSESFDRKPLQSPRDRPGFKLQPDGAGAVAD